MDVKSKTNIVMQIHDFFLDLFFPQSCLGCKKRGSFLCDTCILKLRRAERETGTHIYACYDYRDPLIKKAVWNLKYYRRVNLGNKLGSILYDALLEEIADIRIFAGANPIYVVPVPLSKEKQKIRGYNQAERIAHGFCDSGNAEAENVFKLRNDLVIKKINTDPQARITNRTKRLANIKGAFDLKNKESIKGRTIIVIDDVTTTGGTLTEIIKLLKNSGAKKVVGFAVAH